MIDFAFPLEELEYFLLIFARITAFMFTAPFYSQNNVPRMLKVALSAFISYLLYESIMPHEYVVYDTLLGYTVYVLKETVTGLVIGLAANAAMQISAFAGHIVDTDIGYSMSAQMDPATQQNITVTGYLYQYMFLLLFMVTGLHRYLLQALAQGFAHRTAGPRVKASHFML